MLEPQQVKAPTALDALLISLASTALVTFATAVNVIWVAGVFWVVR